MQRMMPNLSRLEAWIARLIEEPFVRLFARRLLPHDVAATLARVLEDAETTLPDGRQLIPGKVEIYLHPEDWLAMRTHDAQIDARLTQALEHLIQDLGLVLSSAADVRLLPDANLAPRAIRITLPQRTAQETTERIPTRPSAPAAEAPKAWLLLATGQTFPINQNLVRIGRALDNDLILDDPRISRYHAQLRLRYGRYILQDTGSRGGIEVNGYPVQEVMLRSGDLITLGGYTLIYTEGDVVPPSSHPPSGTRPVPTLRER